jgi:hypothetical protein
MINSSKPTIPPEAAAIMAAMVRMPPKPHEEMKVGKPRGKRAKSPKTPAPSPAKS